MALSPVQEREIHSYGFPVDDMITPPLSPPLSSENCLLPYMLDF